MNDDLISRQAVLDALYKLCNTNETLIENPWRDNPHIDALIDAIEELPPVNPQEPKYCDRNICIKNEYNGISCDECEVTKSQSQESEKINCKATKCENCQNHNYCDYEPQKRSEKK